MAIKVIIRQLEYAILGIDYIGSGVAGFTMTGKTDPDAEYTTIPLFSPYILNIGNSFIGPINMARRYSGQIAVYVDMMTMGTNVNLHPFYVQLNAVDNLGVTTPIDETIIYPFGSSGSQLDKTGNISLMYLWDEQSSEWVKCTSLGQSGTGGSSSSSMVLDGVAGTGSTPITGASGAVGWLSSIYEALGNLDIGQINVGSLALDGAPATGVSQASGGSGSIGWLSSIYSALDGLQTGTSGLVTLDGVPATGVLPLTGATGAVGWLSSLYRAVVNLQNTVTNIQTSATSRGTTATLDGTPATGISQALGGSGSIGWLSSIYSALDGLQTGTSGLVTLDGVPATGVLPLTGATGAVGWLSSIYKAIGSQTLAIKDPTGSNSLAVNTDGSLNVKSTTVIGSPVTPITKSLTPNQDTLFTFPVQCRKFDIFNFGTGDVYIAIDKAATVSGADCLRVPYGFYEYEVLGTVVHCVSSSGPSVQIVGVKL